MAFPCSAPDAKALNVQRSETSEDVLANHSLLFTRFLISRICTDFLSLGCTVPSRVRKGACIYLYQLSMHLAFF